VIHSDRPAHHQQSFSNIREFYESPNPTDRPTDERQNHPYHDDRST
jgi:hypothetical protein